MQATSWVSKILRAFALILAGSSAVALAADGPTAIAAQAVNAFGLDLFRQVAKPDANVLLSPYSIQSAMAMACAGAEGKTREEMARVLHYPGDESQLHRSFAALRRSLGMAVATSIARATEMRTRYEDHGIEPMSLDVANRLFGQVGYKFSEPFLALLREQYAAPFQPVDFRLQPAAAARQINDWVEKQTRARIRGVVPAGALDNLTRLVLVNAIYFKAPWEKTFIAESTQPRPFWVNGVKEVRVPTMMQTESLRYAKADGYCTVSLPYVGTQFRFIIILPDRVDGLAAVERNLASADLFSLLDQDLQKVDLRFPKFKLETGPLSVAEKLEAMGMNRAFDKPPGSADFSRITPPSGTNGGTNELYISRIFQKSVLEVDEIGSVAATASYLAFTMRGGPPQKLIQPIEVKVDHPFLFLIQHVESGACLFLGHVMDPR